MGSFFANIFKISQNLGFILGLKCSAWNDFGLKTIVFVPPFTWERVKSGAILKDACISTSLKVYGGGGWDQF